MPVGVTATESFTVENVGGTALTIDKSKPPVGSAEYSPVTSLGEGTVIEPGQSVVEQVSFTPTATGDQTATWLIQGDDGSGLQTVTFDGTGAAAAAPGIAMGDTDVNLPTTGTTTANFPVTLSAASPTPVTVSYATKDGSATAAAGSYVATSGSLTIPAGQTTATIPVTVNGFSSAATQTFRVNLSKPSGATLTAGQGTAYLANLVLPASVGVTDTSVAAPTLGQTASMVFTVTATQLNPGQTFTVQAATADGSATAASGAYAPVTTTLTFSKAQPVQTVTVPVLKAPPAGTNANIALNLSAVSSGANIADKQGIGTIVGGGTPPLPSIYVDNTALARPTSGTATATFTLTLSPPSPQVVQVLAQTASNSTLVPGTDYAPRARRLSDLPAGPDHPDGAGDGLRIVDQLRDGHRLHRDLKGVQRHHRQCGGQGLCGQPYPPPVRLDSVHDGVGRSIGAERGRRAGHPPIAVGYGHHGDRHHGERHRAGRDRLHGDHRHGDHPGGPDPGGLPRSHYLGAAGRAHHQLHRHPQRCPQRHRHRRPDRYGHADLGHHQRHGGPDSDGADIGPPVPADHRRR